MYACYSLAEAELTAMSSRESREESISLEGGEY